MEDNDKLAAVGSDEDTNTAGPSLIEFCIYNSSSEIIKDPELFKLDQRYDDLTDTDLSEGPPKEDSKEWMTNDIFHDTLENDEEFLLSLDNKLRCSVVFSKEFDYGDYVPKYFIKNDTIEWSILKKEAIKYALEYKEYDYNCFRTVYSSEEVTKILDEVAYNPVWDSGLRIGLYDKLNRDGCYCPFDDSFERCHELFGNTTILTDEVCKGCWLKTK